MRTAAALWSVLLAATAALANAGNPFSSNVIALTPKNWRQEVEGLRLLPASYPGVGEAGWCRERDGTPTIRLYKPKKKQKPGSNAQKAVNDYQYERKAVDMKRFLDAQMPDFVEKVKDGADFAKFQDKATRNQLPQVLLFSSKPNTSPLTKYLSVEFRRRILLAEIKPNKKNESILEKYGVTKLPALVVIPPANADGDESAPIHFDGDGFTRHKLHGFLSKHALKDPVLNAKKKEDVKGESANEEEKSQKTGDDEANSKAKEKVHSEL
ncbi:Thioredoxin [Seminavis robusta]|uniref:Thioredoxin n=1 Tax=Seminavis robusta TaxID=568900 RepID=A0A9N8EY64_9STRA|nr:Thioredoxin [Seminavis robusta]|eukprot:Sro2367_g325100.1 Thioredoxin (268) ;mRNA; r:14053-15264